MLLLREATPSSLQKAHRAYLLAEDNQQAACCNGGADNAGHVGAHSVHQQEVGGVVLLANGVSNTGSHGNSGNACGTDQGVDLLAGQLAKSIIFLLFFSLSFMLGFLPMSANLSMSLHFGEGEIKLLIGSYRVLI